MDSSKKVYFITFGCKVNQAETEGYKKKLSTAGYSIASSLDQADIIIINSCRVTRKAESRNEKSLKALARRFPTKKLILTGCDNQRKFPSGIVVLKREDLLKYLLEANKNGIQDDRKDLISKTRGLVKVQDGCNNFCSYCIVPYSRGREVSYNPEEIIKEIKKLEKSGFKEIVLVGINVGKFMHDKCSLAGLLTKILSQTTIPRVRLSSIHPEDINKD
ncbi:MAG: radical SAM protein, partial [Bacteriovoracaceae bacterium]